MKKLLSVKFGDAFLLTVRLVLLAARLGACCYFRDAFLLSVWCLMKKLLSVKLMFLLVACCC